MIRRNGSILAIALGSLALSFTIVAEENPVPGTFPASVFPLFAPDKTVFWIGNPSLSIFDNQTVSFLADHASAIILRAPIQGPTPYYDYVHVVDRLHWANPMLKVLVYGRVQNLTPGEGRASETEILRGMADLGPLLLPIHGPKDETYGDVTQAGYRRWLIDRIMKIIGQTHTDGIGFDFHFHYPMEKPKYLTNWANKDPMRCRQYADGMDKFHTELKARLGEMFLIFNGIWSMPAFPSVYPEQLKLLLLSDGASIEYFGLLVHQKQKPDETSFAVNVAPYLEAMAAYPQTMIIAYGRGPWAYQDYEQDYQWQRYLYALYLMGAGTNSSFKYHGSYQVPAHAGRVGGLDICADQLLELGHPQGPYQATNGCYRRSFEHGLVLAVEPKSPAATCELAQPLFTPEGKEVRDAVTIQPGTAMLLLHKPPRLAGDVRIVFSQPWAPGTDWEQAQIIAEGQDHYLHLQATAVGQEWDHDLMLEPPVRSLYLRPQLTTLIRSTNTDASLQFDLEVDDARKKFTHVVLEVSTRPAGLATTSKATIREPVYRAPGKGPVPLLQGPRIQPTGQWVQLTIDAATELHKTNRFTFKRWSHVRLVGALDLNAIELFRRP